MVKSLSPKSPTKMPYIWVKEAVKSMIKEKELITRLGIRFPDERRELEVSI